MSPAIAVIVPFFNASETLPQLVEALKAQSYPNFIALFVDDGSTDSGHAYIDGIATADSRFRVLTGSHAGPGPARNIGLDEAEKSGVEYVTFVDADDLPLSTMLAEAKEALESSGADIAHYQWSSTVGGTPHKDSTKGTPSIYVWNKLYRRSAIGDIRFIAAKFAEDLAFFLETEVKSPKRIAINKPLYVHFTRAGSLWEHRLPEDVTMAMKTAVLHLDPIMRESNPMLAKQWMCFYIVKLLKTWKKCLCKVLREKRNASINEYIGFVAKIHFPCFYALRFRIAHHVFVLALKVKRVSKLLAEKYEMRRIRINCNHVKQRMAAYPATHKVRVLFHVLDISKWKCQAVYEAMVNTDRFEPFCFVDLSNKEMQLPSEKRRTLFKERVEYLESHGYKIEAGYDLLTDTLVTVEELSPDMFFYQQPWGIRDSLSPKNVSEYAITLYIPYYVPNYSAVDLECNTLFHRCLMYYMVMLEAQSLSYRTRLKNVPHACEFVAVGHPALDAILQQPVCECPDPDSEVVIYAPHWTLHTSSYATNCNYGTFEWSGEAMLRFAKTHPNVRWCFKPHPLLRNSLVSSGMYTEKQAQAYYEAWAEVGIICLDSSYPALFQKSSAMITDCGSFLTEYAVTGKPIVHLLSSHNSLAPIEFLRPLYDSYYKVHDANELHRILNSLILNGIDEKVVARKSELKRIKIVDTTPSSYRILSFLQNNFLQTQENQ